MIETVGLTRQFGTLTAVDNLTMKINDGEVFGFIGPNGAGKTTTIRMIACLISATKGEAYVNGLDIKNPGHALKIRGMVGLLPETPGLYESISAYKNLNFYAKLYDVPDQEREQRIHALLKALGVWERRDDAVGKFSKGMKQKIAIARALVHEPEFLFLDEPTSGLDPEAAITVRNYLLDLKREGRTIFLNTHNLADAERLCDRIGVMKTRLLAMGSPEDLRRMFWSRTTVVQLKHLTPPLMEWARSMPEVREVNEAERTIQIDLSDPERDNPRIISALVGRGAEIEYVTELKRGLEDVYLRLIGGSK